MIRTLHAHDFAAVPYLETSTLMRSHPDGIVFALDKPTVIVGPNGSGKSAMLKALALRTLSFYTGESSLDNNYVSSNEASAYWGMEGSAWQKNFVYLPGLVCESDNGPALFYRPGYLPGDEVSLTHAMMMGYCEEAKAHGRLVDKKSSGQQSQALLAKIRSTLAGTNTLSRYGYTNWRYGKKPACPPPTFMSSDYDVKSEILKTTYGATNAGAIPVVLLDEPEQSLDARAEVQLWQSIAHTDCRKVQVIVATHSLYPLLNPEAFHLVEATPGYILDVQGMLA